MGRFKKVLSLLLAAAVTLTSQTFVFAEGTGEAGNNYASVQWNDSPWVSSWQEGDAASVDESKYQIYPIPHLVTYLQGGSFTMDQNVNVVYGSGVDQATKTYLQEVLGEYNRTSNPVDNVSSSGSHIVIGVQGDQGAADQWFSGKSLQTSDLFNKNDSYALYTENGNIYILGKDQDSAFYGVATLKMMFSSFAGEKFLPVKIEDYSSLSMRGYVEGFYGGWTEEQRISLMKFTRDMKMNLYVYASKSDPYHTGKWAQLYPDNWMNHFKALVKLSEETKCEFAWSVHLVNVVDGLKEIRGDGYNQRMESLQDKINQLYDAGVRRFCLLSDDFGGNVSYELLTQFVNDINEYVKGKGCGSVIYCPQGYCTGWRYGDEWDQMKNLSEDITVFWSGDAVNAPLTTGTVNTAYSKFNHDIVYWSNYPCQEHAKDAILLGNSSKHYGKILSDNNTTHVAGAVSNPIFYAEASKVALFQLASYFWNVNNHDQNVDQLWEQSFKYLEPNVYDAYLTIARNVSDCKNSSRIPGQLEESEYIKATLERVKTKITNGTLSPDDQEAKDLLAEFRHMEHAVDVFRENCSNKELVRELSNPGNTEGGEGWLEALKNVAVAAQAALEGALEKAGNGDVFLIWQKYSKASAEMADYTARRYKYPDAYGSQQKVTAGTKRVVPFVESCMNSLSGCLDEINEIVAQGNGEVAADRIYTNISKWAETPLTIEENEYGLRNLSSVSLEPGEFIGIKTRDVARITEAVLNKTGGEGLELEYSVYGDEWNALSTGKLQTSIDARYVRLVNKTENTITTTIEKLAVTLKNAEAVPVVKNSSMTLAGGNWTVALDGNVNTKVTASQQQRVGDYITVDLGKTQEIKDVEVWTSDSAGQIKGAMLYVSQDDYEYQDLGALSAGEVVPPNRKYTWSGTSGKVGRYLKLKITTGDGNPLQLYEIFVNKSTGGQEEEGISWAVTNTNGSPMLSTDKDLETVFQISNAKKGDYLEYSLTGNTNLESFTVMQGEPCNAVVSITKSDGKTKTLGSLSEMSNTFSDWYNGVRKIRFDFMENSNVSISEVIFRYGADPSGDVGRAVDNIYVGSGGTDKTTPFNLALNRPVKVSGVETANVLPEAAVDGSLDSKWDSQEMKGSNAKGDQWIVVDLGEHLNLIASIKSSYFNKVYPTSYEVQVSDDQEHWLTVASKTKENNGTTYPVDEISLVENGAKPIAARYVRLYFKSINTGASGNAVGLRELEVIGTRYQTDHTYSSIADTLENKECALNGTVDTPTLVGVNLQGMTELQARVIPAWNMDEVDTAAEDIYLAKGVLPLRSNVRNPEGIQAEFQVKVGNGIPVGKDLNLALRRPVTVSDVEKNFNSDTYTSFTGDKVVDGDDSSRWSSGPLDATMQRTPADQWVAVDLGSLTCFIDRITVKYNGKTWPTTYKVQASNDGENWTTVYEPETERASSETRDIVDEIPFQIPLSARYVRMYYEKDKLNQNTPSGDTVSIRELIVTGERTTEEMTYQQIKTANPEAISVANSTSAIDMLARLTALVTVEMKGTVSQARDVQVLLNWDLTGWAAERDIAMTLSGQLPSSSYLRNPDALSVPCQVTKGSPEIRAAREQLRKLLSEADGVEETEYTENSYADFSQKLQAAKEIYQTAEEKEAIDNARNELETAMKKLIAKGSAYKRGDVNNDGSVNLLDLRLVLRHICQKTELTGNAYQAGDVTGDGTINLLDLRMILRFICQKIPSLD